MQKYKVVVKQATVEKIALIKVLRTIGAMPLKKAEKVSALLLEKAPVTLIAGLEQDACKHIQQDLQAIGVIVDVEATDISTPMLADISVEERYEWSSLRSLNKV